MVFPKYRLAACRSYALLVGRPVCQSLMLPGGVETKAQVDPRYLELAALSHSVLLKSGFGDLGLTLCRRSEAIKP